MNKTLLMILAIMSLMILPVAAQGYNGGYGNGGGCGTGGGNGNGGGGNGNGGGGYGNGGFGQGFLITSGTPFSFSGSVVTAGIYGDGLEVATSEGNITVYGLGPNWFWYNLDMSKPVVGDTVSGNGYTVDYNGVVRNVLTDITVNGTLVQLRDETGYTLWRGQRGGYGTAPGTGGFCGGNYAAILAGTPFQYEGEVISTYINFNGLQGIGLEIATTVGNISLSGLGPLYYWDSLGLTKPVVGDVITAIGYTVDYNGNIVNILMSITLEDGTVVPLRNAETGAPLWRTRLQ